MLTKDNLPLYFTSKKLINTFASRNDKIYQQLLDFEGVKIIFEDKELISTANLFLENDLNITRTSQNGFMHRNTLLYRLEKIHKVLGLNLKVFEQAAIFRNLQEYYDMVNS